MLSLLAKLFGIKPKETEVSNPEPVVAAEPEKKTPAKKTAAKKPRAKKAE